MGSAVTGCCAGSRASLSFAWVQILSPAVMCVFLRSVPVSLYCRAPRTVKYPYGCCTASTSFRRRNTLTKHIFILIFQGKRCLHLISQNKFCFSNIPAEKETIFHIYLPTGTRQWTARIRYSKQKIQMDVKLSING